jgi:hypothetical protein
MSTKAMYLLCPSTHLHLAHLFTHLNEFSFRSYHGCRSEVEEAIVSLSLIGGRRIGAVEEQLIVAEAQEEKPWKSKSKMGTHPSKVQSK